MIGHLSAHAVLNSPISDIATWTDHSTLSTKSIRVVVSQDVEYFHENTGIVERRTEITFSKSEKVKLRDAIDVRGVSWMVSDVLKDDGFLVRVAVKTLRPDQQGGYCD